MDTEAQETRGKLPPTLGKGAWPRRPGQASSWDLGPVGGPCWCPGGGCRGGQGHMLQEALLKGMPGLTGTVAEPITRPGKEHISNTVL